MRRHRALLAILLLPLLAACGNEGTPSAGGSPSPQPLISTTGDLQIVSPEPGAVFAPDSVPVELSLTGAEVLEDVATSTDVQPDTGHIHIALDGTTISLLAGLEFDLATENGGPLTPGVHILEVEFVAADHSLFSPREIEQLTFTVKA